MSFLSSFYNQVGIDRSEVDQQLLNIENKTRSNPLKWNGQFSPQLISVLIEKYSSLSDMLFDPFLGSGTLLLEAGLAGLAASGTEVNPAALILARLYEFMNTPPHVRKDILRNVSEVLESKFPLPLMSLGNIQGVEEEEIRDRLMEILSVLDDRRYHFLVEALVVLLDFHSEDLTISRVFRTWDKVRNLVLHLPFSEAPLTAFHADARNTPLQTSSVDLVITSPPYINVFNYHQQYRSSVEFLAWDLLEVAKSEIGSNRKHRSNRFLTVIQYCLDITMVIEELKRVCHRDSRLIFIVGRESSILGTPFYNGEIVTELAHKACGCNLLLRQERVFRNRFGKDIFEDILHFSLDPSVSSVDALARARLLASKVMEVAYNLAPNEGKEYVRLAIEKLGDVEPSPLFGHTRAVKRA